jgi:hypothetical protein
MGAVKIVDANSLSYLYGKLRNRIDEFQDESKTKLDQFQLDTEAEISKLTDTAASDLSSLKEDTSTKLAKLESDTEEDLNTLKTNTTESLNTIEETAKTNIESYQSSMEESIGEAITAAKEAAAAATASADNADEVTNGANANFATKTELSDAIGKITSFEMTTVDKLPDTGSKGYIYLVPADDGSDDDIYNEYVWLETNSKFEKIGTTRIDLTPYAKSTYVSENYLGKNDNAVSASKVNNALTISLNGSSQGAYDGSSSKSIDITPSGIGAAASEHGTHVTYSTDKPSANGTAAAGSASSVARSDHVHPLQTTVSGNAGSADKVNNALTVSLNGTSQGAYDGSEAKSIDITPSSIGAAASSHGTHVTYGSTAPAANGTASAGTASTVSRSDHVHPLQTTVSGNAGSADKVNKALTVSLNGTAQTAFDGSSAVAFDITPSAIGAAASSHGTHVSYSSDAPKADGTASAGTATTVARSDHVHPLQTSVSGNAGSASKVANALTISLNGTSQGAYDGSAAKSIDITPSAIGAAESSHGAHVSYDDTNKPKANGTAAVGTASTVSRSDHVHPLQTTVSGNAGTATKLATARTIALTGVVTGSASFDGSGNTSIATSSTTLATKQELSDAIGKITSFEMTVVDSLPDTGSKGYLYLVSASDGSGDDVYDEYIWIEANSAFEKIGTTRIDLSPYLKSADASTTYLGKTATAAAASKVTNALTISLNGTSQGAYNGSSAKSINITPSGIGAAASSHGTHVTYDDTNTPKANGTAAVGTATTVARSDHVHPLQTTVSGNAGSASKVNNALTVSLNGTAQTAFDGSSAVAFDITPSAIGAAASSHGTHVSYGTSAAALGTSSAGSASTVSRSDHVHALPALTSCTGTLTVAKGGTGATDAATARTNLGVGASGTHDDSYFALASHGTHVTYSTTVPVVAGTAAVGTATTVARSDHVHPVQTSVSGNAGTATKLATARTIALSGAVNGSVSFNGSANVTISTTCNCGTSVPDTLATGSVYFVYEDDDTTES